MIIAVAGVAGTLERGVTGQVKRLERNAPGPDETPEAAARAQHEAWGLLRAMRTAMRQDLGVSEAGAG